MESDLVIMVEECHDVTCESVTPVCSVTSVDTDCEWRVVVGTRRLPLEDGWWEAGWSGSVM